MTEAHDDAFATTRWSLVLQAGQSDSPDARAALEGLCRAYWRPLYGFARRMGHSEPDAQDLIQEFFARFLERKYVRVADRQRGRFRSFLLTCLKHFLAHEREKSLAARRGGQVKFIPWEELVSEQGIDPPAGMGETPEQIYDRQWALSVMDEALSKLKDEHTSAGRSRQFDRFKEFLTSDPPDGSYAVLARDLAMSGNAVGVAVHRFRHRYRDLVREEIAHTVSNPQDVENELSYLLELLAR